MTRKTACLVAALCCAALITAFWSKEIYASSVTPPKDKVSSPALPEEARKLNLPSRSSIVYRNAVLEQDTIWRGEIQVAGWVVVPSQVTLTVEEGAIVRFVSEGALPGQGGGILVQGRLTALGSEEKPIIFTSAYAKPVSGDWQGIVLLASEKKNVIENCRVEGATTGVDAMFAQVGLRNLVVASCGTGIRMRDSFVSAAGGGASGCAVGIHLIDSETELRDMNISAGKRGIVATGGSLYMSGTTIYGNEQTAFEAENTKLKVSAGSFTVNGAGIKLKGCEGTLSHSSILNNKGVGVNLVGSRMRINGNELIQNNGPGLSIVDGGNVVWGNHLSGNNGYDLAYAGIADLPAMGNWWGSTTSALIPGRLNIDRKREGQVLYLPALKAWSKSGF